MLQESDNAGKLRISSGKRSVIDANKTLISIMSMIVTQNNLVVDYFSLKNNNMGNAITLSSFYLHS